MAEAGLFLLLGLLIVGAVMAILITVVLYSYLILYARRIAYLSLYVNDPLIVTYQLLIWQTLSETFTFLVYSSSDYIDRFIQSVVTKLPLILGVIFLSFFAWGVIEYHEVYQERALEAYQAVVVGIVYDIRAGQLLNLGTLGYGLVFPGLRAAKRIQTFFIRTIPFLALSCLRSDILEYARQFVNSTIILVNSLRAWALSPGSITTTNFDGTVAINTFLSATYNLLRDILTCYCAKLDFLGNILFKWISESSTVSLVNNVFSLFVVDTFALVSRTFLANNPGTVPGTTKNYGVIWNLDHFFDRICSIIYDIAGIINAEVRIVILELVGEYNTNLFAPGSPERVLLVADAADVVAGSVCAVFVEPIRYVYRFIMLFILGVVDVLARLVRNIPGLGGVPSVPITCDFREIRALLEIGGSTGIYNTNGLLLGRVYTLVGDLRSFLDVADPTTITSRIVGSLSLILADGILGSYNLLVRFALHLLDSEYRIYSEAKPPRTGDPVTTWTAPTPYPDEPLVCQGFAVFNGITRIQPGNLLVWLQDQVDDPESVLLRIVDVHGAEFADGLRDLGNLSNAQLGNSLRDIVLLILYTVDYIIQTLAYTNVFFTEDTANYATLVNRYRFARWNNKLGQLGDSIETNLKSLHGSTCTSSYDGFFCAFGNLLESILKFIKELGDQVFYMVNSARLQDVKLPNLIESINEVEDQLVAVLAILSNVVPELQITSGKTLRESYNNLSETIPPILILLLEIPNYVVATLQLDVIDTLSTGSPSFTFIATTISDWILKVINYAICKIVDTVTDFLDALADEIDPFNTIVASLISAASSIIKVVKNFLNDFGFEAIGKALAVLTTGLNLFFGLGQDSFTDLLQDFTKALADLFEFLITQAPTFLIDLFFALIEIILPPPLNVIVASLARALRTGLCTILQTFISTAISVLNFFGADLDSVDLNCGTKKRDIYTSDEFFQTNLAKMSRSAYMREGKLAKKVSRAKNAMWNVLHIREKRYASEDEGTASAEYKEGDDDMHIKEDDINKDMVASNETHYREIEGRLPHHIIDINQAMMLVAELVDWEGNTLCDQLVHHVAEVGRKREGEGGLDILTKLTYESCVTRRAVGEIISVMPGMQWFPEDGFYNMFTWLQLLSDAFESYRIYKQHQEDKTLPRHVVLSDTYREGWAKVGLRVDHLTHENYAYVVEEMTLREYFERNNGNYELIASVISMWRAFKSRTGETMRFFDNLSDVAKQAEDSTLQDWLYSYDETDAALNLTTEQRKLRRRWRAMLKVVSSTTNTTIGETQKRAVLNMPPHPTWHALDFEDWEDAMKERDQNMMEAGFPIRRDEAEAYGALASMTYKSEPARKLRSYFAKRVERMYELLSDCETPKACQNRKNMRALFGTVSEGYDAVHRGWRPQRRKDDTPSKIQVFSNSEHKSKEVIRSDINVQLIRDPSIAIVDSPTVDSELGACDFDNVPFCLNCTALDATLQEVSLTTQQFVEYWDGQFDDTFTRYEELNDYIEDDVVNTCNGDGTKTIHWPSDLRVTPNYTVFEIFGNERGAIYGILDFFSNEIVPYFEVSSTAGFLINGVSDGAPSTQPIQDQTHGGLHRVEEYIDSLDVFDPNYAVTSILPVRPIARFIDSLSSAIADIRFVSIPTTDPISEDDVNLPDFEDIGGGTGTKLIEFLDLLFFSDFDYSCERRQLTLLQGIILFTLVGIVVLVIFHALATMYTSVGSAMLLMMATTVVLPILFITTVYFIPVQNIMPTPFVSPPECLGADVAELTFCDIIPKCPAAFVAGLVDGDYTEANCRGTPLPFSLTNCKRDHGVRHTIDWIIVFIRFMSPQVLDFVARFTDPLSGLFDMAGIDLRRFDNVDFSDKDTFDTYVTCLFIYSFIVPVGLLFLQLMWSLFATVILSYGFRVVSKIATLAVYSFLYAWTVFTLLVYNYMFIATGNDQYLISRQLYYDHVEDNDSIAPSKPTYQWVAERTAASIKDNIREMREEYGFVET